MKRAVDAAAITYAAPAMSSEEGLPLANGLIGALIWGDGQPLKVSLDRTDLWDLRPIPEYHGPDYRWQRVAAMHHAGEHEALATRLEAPYRRPAPTKIPAGRIELSLTGDFKRAHLDLATAIATVDVGATKVHVRVDAERRAGLIEIEGGPLQARLIAPAFAGSPPPAPPPIFDASVGDVCELGYASPRWRRGSDYEGFIQTGWGDFVFAVALVRDADRLAWSITTNADDEADPFQQAIAKARDLLGDGAARNRHLAWWDQFWTRTSVALPDPDLSAIYHRDLYKFGAAAREGAPPVALQGPWTIDNGRLPPWKGDYHHDLNTQLSYWPAYSGNRLRAGAGFLDWLWQTREACLDWTRRFYGIDGLNVPMTADLANRQLGGWRQYTHSVATAAWLAQHFWLHWRYSDDDLFLRERAYPWVRAAAVFIDGITGQRDDEGFRTVALSSSPEINDNRPDAWFGAMTNYDIACFHAGLDAAADMAEALGETADAARWRTVAAELPPLATDAAHGLLIAPGMPLPASHRHFSHLLAIHPFGQVDPRRSAAERTLVAASLADIKAKGTELWMGYSFAAWAALLARSGDGDGAYQALLAYGDGFLLKNSFHANGDFANKGYSQAVFKAFTLEGNFAAIAAVYEMLLQSHNDAIHLFPAVPIGWTRIAFAHLLAQGGIDVSAEIVDGRLVSATLKARREQRARLRYGKTLGEIFVSLADDHPRGLTSHELDLLNGGRP
ncbi:MAG: hypothetical protein A4S16_10165 [Proteobacteria bacterium SG_bin6]|nr:MAG: hypothetical protein A4S16_10165 [Proteobacteria bacterium SG_bin6]